MTRRSKTERRGGPSFVLGLRRGLAPFNLAVAAGVATLVAASALSWPRLAALFGLGGGSSGGEAAIAAIITFAAVTLVHTAGHAYMGWRLARGIDAYDSGDLDLAWSLLSVVERPGMEHFDEDGRAAAVLRERRDAEPL